MVQDIYEILPKTLEFQQNENNGADKSDRDSLDLILKHETSMYNQLIGVMDSTLADVLDSLKGIF